MFSGSKLARVLTDEPRGGRGDPTITKNGFSFLLQEGNAQIWVLLINYLEMAEEVSFALPITYHLLTPP